MNTTLAPTRSNLLKLSEDLKFAQLGYELLDQKRSILIVELLTLVDQAVDYEGRVVHALGEAQKSLSDAIMQMGRLRVGNLAGAVNIDYSIELGSRRVMGVTVPKVDTSFSDHSPYFSSEDTSILSELSIDRYRTTLQLMGRLAELKVSIMRLAKEVKKTIKKVNALEKIVIPENKETIAWMRSRIEEQERENFILLKVVKDRMENAKAAVQALTTSEDDDTMKSQGGLHGSSI
ncbi:MAG: V-type ATP synthase subunit D [Sphaerochaeta sp.]|uniref:V-type ATP synthase subunit D n=1 Tax=Sphaerochaeta sp. S2 TaxID=2798868 RepID=UPI0018E91497|nr:V-type ATP synthase subunit D [Sphaerochaeta sp. S2]MCK9347955.1 V-type ATP synthase subunit D [Sphaerochaeta sp.]MDC7231153.1 V-type ATP synthase subunit D [Sphaerochaetaceae bacterium]MBJ2356871.1 V-type ATP synthase subunit D [Sphaerochaeta sp. S2]MDD4301148.1 V-type ATP synthase subunit D [Sphaerochaeta sp.]MDD4647059.1 V-type ATP synthase subunit D [Sphaerochaeta sp.]